MLAAEGTMMEVTYSCRRISWYRVRIGASVSVKGAYSGAHGAAVRVVSAECDEVGGKWAIRPQIWVDFGPQLGPKYGRKWLKSGGVPAVNGRGAWEYAPNPVPIHDPINIPPSHCCSSYPYVSKQPDYQIFYLQLYRNP